MENKKLIAITILSVVIVIALFSILTFTGKGVQEEEIKIGAILHLTGDQAETAEAFLQGIELAVEEIGEIDGKKIKLIVEDDMLSPKQAHTAAVKLVEVNSVDTIILASYLEGMAAGPYLEEQKIPSLVLWDSAEDLENIGEYLFGIGIWTPSSGEKAADYMYNDLGLRKVAIINNLNEWSLAVSDFFEQRFTSLGGEIVSTQSVSPSNSNDYRNVLTKVKTQEIDGIYSPITDGVPQFYKQYYELEIGKPIVSSDIITERHIEILGEIAENIYQTLANNPSETSTQQMIDLYKTKYGQEPDQLLFISWGYDAVYLIKAAAELGDIKDNLYKTQNFKGASGVISIDEKGSSRKLESMFQIKNGEFVLKN